MGITIIRLLKAIFMAVTKSLMKHSLFVVLWTCLVTTGLQSQIRKDAIPAWVTIYEVNDKFKPGTDNISGGYYFILRAFQDHLPSQTRNIQQATRVFNAAGIENVSDIEISFDPSYEKLHIHRIAIIRQGDYIEQGDELKLSFADIEEQAEQRIYDGRKIATIHLKHVRVDDIIYLNYSLTGENPVFEGHYGNKYWLFSTDTMERFVITIISPIGDSLNYKLSNTDQKPYVYVKNNLQYYSWDLKNLKPISQDYYYPSWYNPFPELSLSDFSSWKEVREWAKPLFVFMNPASKELLEWVKNTKSKHPHLKDQATAAIQWVQNEVRYLGLEFHINSHKPADPNSTFHNRYGDCKDKSILLTTMLRLLGIESYPVLVNTELKHELENELPSAHAFNHCVVAIRLQEFMFYVDPTINFQGGTAPDIYFPDYSLGLSLGSNAQGLDRLNGPSLSSVQLHEMYDVPAKNGGGKLEVITTYMGQAADDIRSNLKYNAKSKTQDKYIEYYESLYDGVKIAEDLIITDDTSKNIFIIKESYSIDKLWIQSDSTNTSSPSIINLKGSLLINYLPAFPEEKYDGPLEMTHPVDLEHKITLYLPEPWGLDKKDIMLSNEIMDFTAEYSHVNDSTIQCIYKLKSTNPFLNKNEVENYSDFRTQIEEEISLQVSSNPDSVRTISFLIPVLLTLSSLMVFILLCYFLYQWNPSPGIKEKYYDTIGGWLILPALGLVITPVVMLISIVSTLRETTAFLKFLTFDAFLHSYFWTTITILIQLVFSIGLLCFSILLLLLFIKKRTSVPVLMILFYFSIFLFYLFDSIVLDSLGSELEFSETDKNESLKSLIRSIIALVIWVPYFHLSDRVKGTFVKRLRSTEPPELPSLQTRLAPALEK